MRTAIIVLFCLCLLPYVMAFIAGYYRKQQLGGVDNQRPREQYAQLTGPGARAVGAQQNAWEALALYTAALLAVVATNTEIQLLALVATIILIARILHGIFYLANLDKLRSLSFLVAFIGCVYLFFAVFLNLSMRLAL